MEPTEEQKAKRAAYLAAKAKQDATAGAGRRAGMNWRVVGPLAAGAGVVVAGFFTMFGIQDTVLRTGNPQQEKFRGIQFGSRARSE